ICRADRKCIAGRIWPKPWCAESGLQAHRRTGTRSKELVRSKKRPKRLLSAGPYAHLRRCPGGYSPHGGRRDLLIGKKIADSRRVLHWMLSILDQLQNEQTLDFGHDRLSAAAMLSLRQEAPMVDPADVIKTAIHSAFVKYPMEDDPDFNPHWIKA